MRGSTQLSIIDMLVQTVATQRRLDTFSAHVSIYVLRLNGNNCVFYVPNLAMQPRSPVNMTWEIANEK